MGWFDRHRDPIEEQRRELERELERVRRQIKRLETHGEPSRKQARPLTPESRPIGQPAKPRRRPAAPTPANEPIFEDVPARTPEPLPALEDGATAADSRELYNHAGLRKYDLVGLLRRIRSAIFGASEEDKKLINYLAAGSIHGLRPLRHEKRVARNRAFLAAGVLAAVVWGVLYQVFGAP